MEKMTSMLLMLVMIGAFIAASQAVTCYNCRLGCNDPFSSSDSPGTCRGEVCYKIKWESADADDDVTRRGCILRSSLKGPLGCSTGTYEGHSAAFCYCDKEKCNGAAMTSSFGHVITAAVALIISVVIGYLL